jgi:GntR family transcriptional repressor for pyruvate dehydrogenase complex
METGCTPREILILETIQGSSEPLGAWNLVELLAARGVQVGPSTAGRVLNHLEQQGYLARSALNKGRAITEKGLACLARVEQERHLRPLNEQLGEVVNSRELETDLMVLEARKALERTTVRLAAERIRDDELAELERLVSEREAGYQRGESVAALDVAFHTLIARASRNEVLNLLYQTIATFGQQSRRFENMRRRVGAPYQEAHRHIVEALRARDGDAAEAEIAQHIDALIRDVKRYWEEFID